MPAKYMKEIVMDKFIEKSMNIKNRYTLNYRFINVASFETGESINIGLVVEEKEKAPRIKIIENIELVKELFPILDINHIEFCTKAIEIKYKMKKVTKSELKISNTVTISNTRLYKVDYDNLYNIDNILFNKYISIQKTQNLFTYFYKKFHLIDKKLKNLEADFKSDSIIDIEIITKPLINSDTMKHNFQVLKKLQKVGLN